MTILPLLVPLGQRPAITPSSMTPAHVTIDMHQQQPACPTDYEFSATIAKLDEASNTTDLCRQMLYSSWNSVAQLNSALHQARETHFELVNAYDKLHETHQRMSEELSRLKDGYCGLVRHWQQSCRLLQECKRVSTDYVHEGPCCCCKDEMVPDLGVGTIVPQPSHKRATMRWRGAIAHQQGREIPLLYHDCCAKKK